MSGKRVINVLCAGVLGAVVSQASAQTMSVSDNVHHDVSDALTSMPKNLSLVPTPPPHEAEPIRRIPLPPALKVPVEEDFVLQRTLALTPLKSAPAYIINHEGLGDGTISVDVAPPDTNGAIGSTQYVQFVNAAIGVFDKTTATPLMGGAIQANVIWRKFGGSCEHQNAGDGMVVYDKQANRWVISQFTGEKAPFLQCIAVSTTPDATGRYYRYSFTYNNFNDYPKMGVWSDAYYVTFNNYQPVENGAFLGANACAYDRSAMLAGKSARQICFQLPDSVGGLLPADLDGATPPPVGSPNYLVNFGSNALDLFKFHVDFATPAKSTFKGPTVIQVAPFTPLCNGDTCVPQPKVAQQLDSLADRMMFRLAYRNFGSHESLVANHSVAVGPSGGGVRWYEIRNPGGTPNVAQQSTFAPDASFRWMGSVAMDASGDMALGYALVDGASNYPSIAYTGRTASDPINTMESEVVVVKGGGSQVPWVDAQGTTHPLSRWGDYSSMQIDPVDDCTFWFTQEYLQTTGSFNWRTKIVAFRFPNCNTASH